MNYRNFIIPAFLVVLGAGCFSSADSEILLDEPLALDEVDQVALSDELAPLDPSITPSAPNGMLNGELPSFYYHGVVFATGSSATEFDRSTTLIAENASVPDLMVISKAVGDMQIGDTVSYFVDSSPIAQGDKEQVAFILSKDNGQTWSERVAIKLVDQEDMLAVDPSVVQLEDGRLRLYYFDINGYRNNSSYRFYSAISEDGINFELEGLALESEEFMTDPEVVKFDDTWYMYWAMHADDGSVWVATSEDGLSFDDRKIIDDFFGIPGAMVTDDGVDLYGCRFDGVSYARSEDGINFNISSDSILTYDGLLCDPSPAVLADGSVGLVAKVIVEN